MSKTHIPWISHSLILFLLLYRQRATNIDPAIREQRLRYFSAPIRNSWMDDQFKRTVTTFPGFCEAFGLDRVWRYLEAREVWKVPDWATIPLDEEGQKMRDEIGATFSVRVAIPLLFLPKSQCGNDS